MIAGQRGSDFENAAQRENDKNAEAFQRYKKNSIILLIISANTFN